MKRAVITVENVQDARRQGVRQLSIPGSGIVTPAAADMAVSLGIGIVRESTPAQQAARNMSADAKTARTGPSGPAAAPGNRQKPRTIPPAVAGSLPDEHPGGIPLGSGTSSSGGDSNGRPPSDNTEPSRSGREDSSANPEALYARVRKQVIERLPESMRGEPMVDELIRKSMAAVLQKQSAESGEQPRPVHYTSAPPSSPAKSTGKASPEAVWKESAGRGTRINSAALPWKKPSSAGDGVNIIDALACANGLPCSVGYMEWESSSFVWDAKHSEITVILQGELEFSIDGNSLRAKAGDVLHIPKGAQVRFSSPGYVKFVYISCPEATGGSV